MPQTNYLATYAKALWGQKMHLSDVETDLSRTVLSLQMQATLNVPCRESTWPKNALACAQVAHAAAHQMFAHPPQNRGRLKPVQLALYGVLEDARVEYLAMRELPGLRAVWLPFHSGEHALHGNGFEALLARLARVLLDPEYHDSHAWVQKVKRIFYTPASSPTLALNNSVALREVVSMLGNEIGQMRLPFNPAGYCVHAEYRDDNSHLWLPAEDAFVSSTPLESVQPKVEDTPVSGPAPEISASAITQPTQPAGLSKFSYPEWDYRTGFYRPNWCQVYAGFAPLLDMAQSFEEQPLTQLWQKWLNHRQSELRRSHRREYEGDVFHTNGLIDAHINQRMGQQIDMRVYRRLDWEHQITSVLFLIDLSVSTGQALLQRHANAALYCAERLVQQGHACAVWGFRSWGRADVEVLWLKSWQEAMSSPQVKIRMARLRCGGSTRLGAVLRHAIHMLSIRHATAEMIILGDGEAHDIDVHDSRYLKRDFIQACREAKLKGHQVLRYHDGNLY